MSNFKIKLTNMTNAVVNTTKQHSPEILLAVGAVGTVAAAVMACKATVKAPEVLEKHKELLNDIHVAHAQTDAEEYSEADYRKDLVIAYSRTAFELVKLYGPAVALELASLGSMFASNDIMRKRNASLATALVGMDTAFKKYRKNVIEKYGEDADKNLRMGLKTEKKEVINIDDDGNESHSKESVNTYSEDDVLCNPYVRFFGPDYSREATKSPEYNMTFLLQRERYWDDILKSRYEWRPNGKSKLGYVYLEEVLKDLDLLDPEEEMPHYVGWLYDAEDPKKYGDGTISFRITNAYKQNNERFVNRSEHTAVLDFNCDGVISDKVYRKKTNQSK